MFLNGPPGDNRPLAEYSKWLDVIKPSPHAKESLSPNEAAFRSWKTKLETPYF